MRIEELTYDAGRLVPMGRHIRATRKFTANGIDIDGCPVLIGIDAEWSESANALVISELRATARDGGEPVTGTSLRSVPVAEALAIASNRAYGRSAKTRFGGMDAVQAALRENVERLRNQGPTEETLEWVGLLYEFSNLLGDPPAKSVRELLGIPARTATHWIKLARERGHL